MPSPQRRHRRRQRQNSNSPFWSRLFDLLTHRATIGALWIAAAVVCVLVVGTDPTSWSSSQDWFGPLVEPEMARGLAVVILVAIAGLTGLSLKRWRNETSPDRVVANVSSRPTTTSRLVRIGVGLMVLGMAVVVGDWLATHQNVPAGKLVLPLGESKESLEVEHGDRDVEVMLPMRTTAHYLDLEKEAPKVWLQFATPDREIDDPVPDELESFRPGESLDVEGKRFVFTGLSDEIQRRRAFLSSPDEDTRRDGGVVGEEIQVSIDGPSFRITDITDDYLDVFAMAPGLERARAQVMLLVQRYPLGAMGPAVELETEDGERFRVFERGGESVDDGPYVDESLQVDGIQKLPSPVMTVTEVRPFWPFALGMGLFVIGWLLSFFFPERLARRREDGDFDLWSLNWIERPLETGKNPSILSKLVGVAPLVALVGLALSLGVGASQAGILLVAGLVALLGLPGRADDINGVRSTIAGLAVPVTVVVGATVVVGGLHWSGALQEERILWAAHLGSWLAMATALLGAGVAAEESLEQRSTGGMITIGLGIWAAMGSVVAMAMQRGGAVGEGLGLPLAVDGESLSWSIPNVEVAEALEIPVVADGTELGVIAAVVGLLATLGVVGVVFERSRVALFGWIGSLATSVTGVIYLLNSGDSAVGLPDQTAYREAAERWLESRDLPGWLAEMGEFGPAGDAGLATTALAPELMAFVGAATLAVVAIALVVHRQVTGNGDEAGTNPYGGRDLMFRAVTLGAMGWVLGLFLSWERVGAAGIRAPMEWLGLSAVLVALGLLMLGWRRGRSVPQKLLRAFGPALVLCYLIWVFALGAAGGTAPGASIPLL